MPVAQGAGNGNAQEVRAVMHVLMLAIFVVLWLWRDRQHKDEVRWLTEENGRWLTKESYKYVGGEKPRLRVVK